MKYRFSYAELVMKYSTSPTDATEEWEEKASLEVASPVILAGALRALANELDPPKQVMR